MGEADGDVDTAVWLGFAMIFGELDKLAGKTAGEVEEENVTDLLIHGADTLGEDAGDLDGEGGVVFEEAKEVVAVEGVDLCGFDCFGRGGTGFVVNEG